MALAFISRIPSAESDFVRLLKKAGWTVKGAPLVQLEALPIDFVPAADWWFFSSKNAVSFLLQQHPVPAGVRLAALGPGTAQAIVQHTGRQPDFVGTGNPVNTAELFVKAAKGFKVLFPGAVQSLQSVLLLVNNRLEGLHLSVYKNTARLDPPDMTKADALVFTSPLNAQAYCNRFPIEAQQQIVAIGNSTAQMLHNLGYPTVRLASEPTETALAIAVLGS